MFDRIPRIILGRWVTTHCKTVLHAHFPIAEVLLGLAPEASASGLGDWQGAGSESLPLLHDEVSIPVGLKDGNT